MFRFVNIARTALLGALLVVASQAAADVTLEQPRDLMDLSSITAAATQTELGTRPEVLLAFVRDRIRQDVYAGLLRGPEGTLIAEAGNSLDKAALLQEMLRLAGYEARIVHGSLDETQAALLLSRALPAAAEATVAASDDPAARVRASVARRAGAQFAMIVDLLQGAGIDTAVPVAKREALIAELRDHYWVQYRDSAGAGWVDADPGFADAAPGRAYGSDAEILESVPEALYHRVTLRVVLETVGASGRQSQPVLVYEARAADLASRLLVLVHQPASWTGPVEMVELGRVLDKGFEALIGGLDIFGEDPATPPAEDALLPILLVGTELHKGEVFDLTAPENEAAGRAEKDKAAAEWIEITLTAPDGSTTTTERMLFDRIGVAERSAGAVGLSNAPLGLDHPRLGVYGISVFAGPLGQRALAAVVTEDPGVVTVDAKAELTAGQVGQLLAGLNTTVALLSDLSTTAMRSGGGGAAVFGVSQPRIVISTFKSDAAAISLSLDLRLMNYRLISDSEEQLSRGFELAVAKGVLEGVLETEVLRLLVEEPDAVLHRSTVEVLETAKEAGIAVRLVHDAAGVPPSLPADVAARIAADLAAGNVVVLPDVAVAATGQEPVTAWWKIDRRTGATVAVTEDGLHQAATEYVITKDGEGGFIAVRISQGGEKGARFVMQNGGRLRVWLEAAQKLGWKVYELGPEGFTAL